MPTATARLRADATTSTEAPRVSSGSLRSGSMASDLTDAAGIGAGARREAAPGGLRLVHAAVVFRHGARAPLTARCGAREVSWPVCDAKAAAAPAAPVAVSLAGGLPAPENPMDVVQRTTPLVGGCHAGELSDLGRRQAHALGESLRRRLVEELGLFGSSVPDAPPPGAVEARSTNSARTVATLGGVLAGLFPALAEDGAPVTTATVGRSEDEHFVPNTQGCARLKQLLKDAAPFTTDRLAGAAADEAQEMVEYAVQDRPDLLDALRRDNGIMSLVDVAMVHEAHGIEGPTPWRLSAHQLERARVLGARVANTMLAASDERLRLSVGRVLHDVLNGVERSAHGVDGSTKLRLFSAHDTTVMPLLVALRPDMRHSLPWPPYAAHVSVELYAEGGDSEGTPPARYLVGAAYNGEPLPLPCAEAKTGLCPLADFRAAVSRLLPADFRAECAPVT